MTSRLSSKIAASTRSLTSHHQTIKQAERLRLTPIPGLNTWYKAYPESSQNHQQVQVNFQNLSNGQTGSISLGGNFPESFEDVKVSIDGKDMEVCENIRFKKNGQMKSLRDILSEIKNM